MIREIRVDKATASQHEAGATIGAADVFEAGGTVDVTGISKGRGFAGVMKRYNFSGFIRTHGTHEFFRHGGSIGAGAYPGKVIKGLGMFGRMGAEQVTVRNLEVVAVEADRNLVVIRGAIPGHANGLVRLRPAVAAH